MKLQELIEKSLTEDDMREVLGNLNLDHSGSRKELCARFLNEIEGRSAKEVLSSFSSEVLIKICKANDIKPDWPFFSDSKEQLMKKICSRILGKNEARSDGDQSIKQMDLPHPTREIKHESDKRSPAKAETMIVSHPRRTNSSFEEVVRDIEEWLPRTTYNHESLYRDELNPWLWSRGHLTTIRKGDSTVSVIVDNKYPIMILVEPELTDFHRAFGQFHRYLEGFQSAVMVVCRPKQDGELEFFEERVRRSLAYSRHQYKIIKKK